MIHVTYIYICIYIIYIHIYLIWVIFGIFGLFSVKEPLNNMRILWGSLVQFLGAIFGGGERHRRGFGGVVPRWWGQNVDDGKGIQSF